MHKIGFQTRTVTPGQNALPLTTTFSIGIDWLQGTGSTDRLSDLLQILEFDGDRCTIYPDSPFTSGKKYSHHARSTRGAILAWNESALGNFNYLLILPGAFLSRLDLPDSKLLVDSLSRFAGFKCTRLDIALDDFSKSISPADVSSACQRGDYTGFQTYDPRFPLKFGRYAGFTIYLGSNKSEKRVRFYDKSFESGGEIDSYRWEAQFRKSSADVVFRFLRDTVSIADQDLEERYISILKDISVGLVDFLDRSSNREGGDLRRAGKSKRLPFWEKFLESLSAKGIRIRPIRKKISLKSKIEWIERQVIPSLSLISEALQDRFKRYLSLAIARGKDRLSSFQRSILQVESGDPDFSQIFSQYL